MRAGDHPIERCFGRDVLPFSGAAVFELDRAAGDPARSDDQLIGKADQIHRGEFRPGRFVSVVIQHLDAGAEQLRVEVVGDIAAARVALTQVDQADTERGNTFRPNDAGIVVVRLDQELPRPAEASLPHTVEVSR